MIDVSLKNLKVLESRCEETICFEATLYVDGKRFCQVSNDGNGGPHSYKPLPSSPIRSKVKTDDKLQELDNRLNMYGVKLNILGEEKVCSLNLDILVEQEVSKMLRDKEIKKITKKIAYIDENNDIFTVKSKHKPTLENLEAIKKTKEWKPGNHLLNEMNMEDIRKLPPFQIEELQIVEL